MPLIKGPKFVQGRSPVTIRWGSYSLRGQRAGMGRKSGLGLRRQAAGHGTTGGFPVRLLCLPGRMRMSSMRKKMILVTSSGLIGSEAVEHFCKMTKSSTRELIWFLR